MIASRQRPRRTVVASRRSPPSPGSSAETIIAYDYGATFKLTGRPGNIIEDVINISSEGTFVAVAIGYGFEEERGKPLELVNLPSPAPLPGDLTLNSIPVSALIEGFRVNPRFEHLIFETPGETSRSLGRERVFLDEDVPENLLKTDGIRPSLFERVKTPEEISFFFSIVDSSTGRELQDEPTHNLASLGKSNGERPFRLLAQPITFAPRSTVRLQIIERTEGVTGTLFIVLYGYTILGTSVCPETVARRLTGRWQCPVETIGRPSDRVIPFDYVVTIPLSGRPKNLAENETTVNAEGGFVATAVGYGLLVEEQKVLIQWERFVDLPSSPDMDPVRGTAQSWINQKKKQQPGASPLILDLGLLPLRLLPTGALMDGIRIRPDLVRLAFQDNAQPASELRLELFDALFERLNRSEDVSFRYTIFDSGRGRELQNIPLHNVAGLGIANGDRPFKRLARPMVFLPRSTIRIQVEERFGSGKLFFVFQGYKILGSATRGGRG